MNIYKILLMGIFTVTTSTWVEGAEKRPDREATKNSLGTDIHCPSTSALSSDLAQILFTVDNSISYDDMIKAIQTELANSDDERVQQVSEKKSQHFEYKGLPRFEFDPKQFVTYQYPERVLEYVLIRPREDCIVFLNQEQASTPHEEKVVEYVLARSFSYDQQNLAVLRGIKAIATDMVGVTDQGAQWLQQIQ